MAHIINKFAPEVIIAGILRLIADKGLRTKYIPYCDYRFFCHNLEDQQSLDIKTLVRSLKNIHDAGRDKEISMLTMGQLLQQNLGEFKDLDRFLMQWASWASNPKLAEYAKDEASFNVFVEYLKVIAVAKNVAPFSADYQVGNITQASTKLDQMLDTVRKIEGMALADTLSNIDVEDVIYKPEVMDTRRFFYLGCQPIDDAIGGFPEQTLNLIIGVSGGGKSATGHHILRQCIETQTRVYISVCEDRPDSFVLKLVAALTGIEINRLKKGPLTSDDRTLIKKAKLDIGEYIKADFVYGQDITTVHRLAADYDQICLSANKPLPLVNIVDYTGHIASKSNGDKGFEKMRNAYAERKDYALLNRKVCFDFAQVNREGSKRLNDEKILTQNDLAGAFDIAQVCDNIMSINRNAMNKTDSLAEFHISKARDGITGVTVSVGTEFHRARFNMKNFTIIQAPSEFLSQYRG